MIKICENYYLDVTPYNFTLCEKTKNEDGEMIYEELTYHNDLSGVYNSIKRKKLRGEGVKTIEALTKRVDKVENTISGLKNITLKELLEELEKNII